MTEPREDRTSTLTYMQIHDLERPRDGECRVNRWWVVHPDKGAAFYAKPGSDRSVGPVEAVPQCNVSMLFIDELCESMYPGHYSQRIDVAYLGNLP